MSATEPARDLNAHIWARETHEHYVEERWVSAALFREEGFVGEICDPCCGFGHIVRSAIAAGLEAFGQDIVDRGGVPPWNIEDFTQSVAPRDNIVCNPPFDKIQEFTEQACRLARRKAALIFPTRRLNAAGKWLADLPLARIWYLTPRPSMPPGHVFRRLENQGKRPSGGTQDFCWLVFQRGHSGRVEAAWLHRDRAPA